MINDSTQYIARISYGKDSLKMLDVIYTRGLPLDRITTTDVWATDTISANLPPMEAFKAQMDQRIWDMYRIEVEHLCARNPDGSKRTYEQMFYHVPKRKSSQSVQVERERERDGSGPAPSKGSRYTEFRGVNQRSNDLPDYRVQGSIKGFPGTVGVNWCQKLKICGLSNQGVPPIQEGEWGQVVPGPQDNLCFPGSARRGAGTEISSNTWVLQQMSQNGTDS